MCHTFSRFYTEMYVPQTSEAAHSPSTFSVSCRVWNDIDRWVKVISEIHLKIWKTKTEEVMLADNMESLQDGMARWTLRRYKGISVSPSEIMDRYNLKNMWIVILGESFIDIQDHLSHGLWSHTQLHIVLTSRVFTSIQGVFVLQPIFEAVACTIPNMLRSLDRWFDTDWFWNQNSDTTLLTIKGAVFF